MFFIYIIKNNDWIDMYKYGYTKSILNRLYNSHEQHSYISSYNNIWKLEKMKNYKLPYDKPDEIFSLLCRNINYIKSLELLYNYDFIYLKELNNFLINNGGGREFVNINGLQTIYNIINIEFPILGIKIIKEYSIDDIDTINKYHKKINTYKLKNEKKYKDFFNHIKFTNMNNINLFPYQQECLEKSRELYKINKKHILNWACGLGKTIMSLNISKDYFENYLLIGVSSLTLVNQWINDIETIYNNIPLLIICSDFKNSKYTITTSTNIIKKWFDDNIKGIVLISYQSSNKLYSAIKNHEKDIIFDFAIFDECHHLCTSLENNNKYSSNTDILKINCKKQLSLTATMKMLKNKEKIDNYDKEIFGEILDSKSVKWAIDNKKITDYWVLTINMSNEELEEIIVKYNIDVEKKELFLAAYICLKSTLQYKNFTHTLIYTNSIESANLVNNYIEILIEKNVFNIIRNDIYNKSLHSKISLKNQLNNFIKSKYGIISCVYLFGEGFNLPKLTGAVFAENMGSDIRINQSALRPNRLDKNNLNKKAYLVIPYIDNDIDNFIINNNTFLKVRNIIKKLRIIDENIEQRIMAPKKYEKKLENDVEIYEEDKIINTIELENDDELCNKIILMLRDSNALGRNGLSEEQIEYIKCKIINREQNIKSFIDYHNKKEEISYIYKIDPENYFKNSGVWKDAYDFFNVDITIFPKGKDAWIRKCRELKVRSLEDYLEKCKDHLELPLYPEIIYKDIKTLEIELQLNFRR